MSSLDALVARIPGPDAALYDRTQLAFDAKTKPRRSLGRLEEIGCRLVAVRGSVPPTLAPTIIVAAGDHGVAREGVSAYPQEVTGQMVANFASGGAAINVLARAAGARLVVVDAGVAVPLELDGVRSLRIGPGTASFVDGPAMTREDALRAIDAGVALACELAGDGTNVLALGEMGIGNTSSASAIAAAVIGVDPSDVCGRGTGLDDDGVARKIDVVRRALRRNTVDASDGVGVLAAFGGFEIAVLTGAILAAAADRVPVVLDGFITGAAALAAVAIAPLVVGSLIASHRSAEPGHALVLDALGLKPILELDMRLGEGSGAALVLPLLASSVAILNEMATFDEANVTDAGR